MNPRHLRLLSCAVLCFGIASVLFFSYQSSGGRVLFDGIIAWALVPYLVAFGAAFPPQTRAGACVILLGCALLVGGGAWAYHDAFSVHPDTQDGLVFVFFPPIQLVGSVALLVYACIASFASVRAA